MLDLDWLALGVAVKYQLPLDNSPQSTLMWKRHQAFSTHRRTLMSEKLIKTPIRYYFIIIDYGIKKNKTMLVDIFEMMPDNPRPKNDCYDCIGCPHLENITVNSSKEVYIECDLEE